MSVNKEEFRPVIVAFCCNWCSYAGADLAGSSRLAYPADVKIIRVPCSCRVNPMFILRAFETYNSKTTANITVGFNFKKVFLCDMLENNQKELTFSENTVSVPFKNFEINTLKFII